MVNKTSDDESLNNELLYEASIVYCKVVTDVNKTLQIMEWL